MVMIPGDREITMSQRSDYDLAALEASSRARSKKKNFGITTIGTPYEKAYCIYKVPGTM